MSVANWQLLGENLHYLKKLITKLNAVVKKFIYK